MSALSKSSAIAEPVWANSEHGMRVDVARLGLNHAAEFGDHLLDFIQEHVAGALSLLDFGVSDDWLSLREGSNSFAERKATMKTVTEFLAVTKH